MSIFRKLNTDDQGRDATPDDPQLTFGGPVTIFFAQVVSLAIAVGCWGMVYWINLIPGCILSLSVFDTCVINLALTLPPFLVAMLSALGFMASFLGYFSSLSHVYVFVGQLLCSALSLVGGGYFILGFMTFPNASYLCSSSIRV